MAKTRAPKKSLAVHPKVSASEIRKILPNARAEQRVKISERDLRGSFKGMVENLKKKAADGGIKGNFEIATRTTTRKRGRWGTYSDTDLYLIGLRPYTDEELEKEGRKLVEKERKRLIAAHKKAVKKVNDFNRLAADLGQSMMEIPEPPVLPELPK